MSWQKFDDECPGCKPALLDLQTGQVKPDDSQEMVAIFGVWKNTTLEERQAWHRVCCQQSPTRDDIRFADEFALRVKAALEAI